MKELFTDTINRYVKEVVQLRKKSKARSQAGVFLVQGIRMKPQDRDERINNRK